MPALYVLNIVFSRICPTVTTTLPRMFGIFLKLAQLSQSSKTDSTEFARQLMVGLEGYFDALYGLFPWNLVIFLQKSHDQMSDSVRLYIETLFNLHVLHTKFMSSSVDDEIYPGRWPKLTPDEIYVLIIRCRLDYHVPAIQTGSIKQVADEYQQVKSQKSGDSGVFDSLVEQVTLLGCEVLYEQYRRQQYLQLVQYTNRRAELKSESEAGHQSLYQMYRAQKADLNRTTELWEKQRQEIAVVFKGKHAKWEAELNQKLKNTREDNRSMAVEISDLQARIIMLLKKNETLETERNQAVDALNRSKYDDSLGDS